MTPSGHLIFLLPLSLLLIDRGDSYADVPQRRLCRKHFPPQHRALNRPFPVAVPHQRTHRALNQPFPASVRSLFAHRDTAIWPPGISRASSPCQVRTPTAHRALFCPFLVAVPLLRTHRDQNPPFSGAVRTILSWRRQINV